MNYVINAILIAFNVISTAIEPKKEKNDVLEAIKEHNKELLLKDYKILNIILIVMNIVFIVLKILFKVNFIADAIITPVLLVTFIIYANHNKKEKKEKKYNILGRDNKRLYKMMINLIILLVFIEKVASIKEIYAMGYLSFIGLVFAGINVARIISFFKENKEITKYSASREDYLEDIKNHLYIEKKKLLSYFGVGLIIGIVLFVRIPYGYAVYILITVLALIIYNSEVSRLKRDKRKTDDNIYRMNVDPGPVAVTRFKQILNNTSNLMLFIIMFATLSIISYVVGEIEFIVVAIDMQLIVTYTLFEAKRDYIYTVYALEKENINKEKYSVNIKDQITDVIEYKKLFVDLKLYKIVYVDKENNVYVSGIELYNIKDKHDNIEIYINSTNMNDYIVVEEEYY